MMRLSIALLVLALGCGKGTAKEEPKEEPKPKVEESKGWSDRLGDVADKAKSVGDVAKTVGGDVADKAKSMSGDVTDKAKALAIEMAIKAATLSSSAIDAGRRLKDELHKAHAMTFDYDIAIDTVTEAESDHLARISGMKQLKVGAYTIGFEQDSKHPLGEVYKWQFRATWRITDGRAVRLSFFTNEELKIADFGLLLATLVPIAEKSLPRLPL